MARKPQTNKTGKAGKAGKAQKADVGDAAWARLTADTRPLQSESRNRHIEANSKNKPKTKQVTKQKTKPLADTAPAPNVGRKSPSQSPAKRPPPPLQDALPPKTRRRLARGTITIDATLDLHGMTLAEAEAALTAFVARARARHQSWLLVITGKGRHSEGGRGEGKLRGALPDWLDRGALAGQVVEYAPAAPPHGGGGAFYLRVRRPKSA